MRSDQSPRSSMVIVKPGTKFDLSLGTKCIDEKADRHILAVSLHPPTHHHDDT